MLPEASIPTPTPIDIFDILILKLWILIVLMVVAHMAMQWLYVLG